MVLLWPFQTLDREHGPRLDERAEFARSSISKNRGDFFTAAATVLTTAATSVACCSCGLRAAENRLSTACGPKAIARHGLSAGEVASLSRRARQVYPIGPEAIEKFWTFDLASTIHRRVENLSCRDGHIGIGKGSGGERARFRPGRQDRSAADSIGRRTVVTKIPRRTATII